MTVSSQRCKNTPQSSEILKSRRRKNKSQLEINPPTYKPTNTDTIWVGVREALVGKTKGHELSAEVFSAWNISFLFTNTFSFEDLIKWVSLRSTGTQQNNKSSVVRPRVKQHAAK